MVYVAHMNPGKRERRPFGRADIERDRAELGLLHRGGFANADVYRYQRSDGGWVVKDFRTCPWLFRATVGQIMVRREAAALTRLNGVPGVPADAFIIDADAFADRDMGGKPMHEAAAEATDSRFFRRLERLVWRMHRRGMAHLDLRYRRNILVLDDDSPGIVDFQSAVCLDRLPRRMKRFLRRVDLSGVYKHWCQRDPGTLGARRLAILRNSNRLRSWWVLKGYSIFGVKESAWRKYEHDASRGSA